MAKKVIISLSQDTKDWFYDIWMKPTTPKVGWLQFSPWEERGSDNNTFGTDTTITKDPFIKDNGG